MIPELDRFYMARALHLAEQAEVAGEVPVGALVVRPVEWSGLLTGTFLATGTFPATGTLPGENAAELLAAVVAEGFNQPITASDPTAHAEIVALRAAAARVGNYRLPGCTLYVTIEPCTMCLGAMIHARIRRLVFGALEPRAGAVVSQLKVLDQGFFNHRLEWSGGVMAEECGARMAGFFRNKRAK